MCVCVCAGEREREREREREIAYRGGNDDKVKPVPPALEKVKKPVTVHVNRQLANVEQGKAEINQIIHLQLLAPKKKSEYQVTHLQLQLAPRKKNPEINQVKHF